MKLLSIETSCDDTCVSIYEVKGGVTNASFKVLANNANSQINIHVPYGGVFPVMAKREHEKNLPLLLEASLNQAKLLNVGKPVDTIAVTYGPGLEICLWTGITFAQSLAKKWNVPLIPTDHMEGHLLSVFGKNKGTFKIPKIKTPMLSLLVSGGHTQMVLVKKWMDYEIVGETLDDAIGEAFDKVARMLGLPYPGGPQISKLAQGERDLLERNLQEPGKQVLRGRNFSAEKFAQSSSRRPAESPQDLFPISLPRPMLYTKDFNFSFSGLKTAVLYLIKKLGGVEALDKKTKAQIALEFENAAIECIIYKTKKAVEKYNIKTISIGGGVSANKYLRSELEKLAGKKIKLLFPAEGLSTDNALMIGIAGYLNFIKNKKKVPKPATIKANGNLKL